MNFHQTTSERLRDQVFEQLLKLDVFKEGVTMVSLIEVFPKWDEMSEVVSSSDEEPDVVVKEELFTDTIVEPTKDKVDKADKAEDKADKADKVEDKVEDKADKVEDKAIKEPNVNDPDKPKRPPSSFVYFKSHPDSQDDILAASKEMNEETGKIFGKVKGAGRVWGKVSDEDKVSWKQRAIESHNEKMAAKTEEMEEIN